MSRAKNIARARAGNPHTSGVSVGMVRRYVCANCHKRGQFVKVGDYYYHNDCPKVMVPFADDEVIE